TPSITVETPQYGPDAADALLRARGIDPDPPQPLPNSDVNLDGYVPESQVNPGSTQMPATEPAMPPEAPPAPARVNFSDPVQVNMSNPEMPTGCQGEGYQVDPEMARLAQKVADGEMTAEEAMAQAGKAAAPSAESSAATAAAESTAGGESAATAAAAESAAGAESAATAAATEGGAGAEGAAAAAATEGGAGAEGAAASGTGDAGGGVSKAV